MWLPPKSGWIEVVERALVTKYRCMGQSVANNHDVGNLCNVYGLNTNLKRESSQTTISMITTSVYISRDHFVAKS